MSTSKNKIVQILTYLIFVQSTMSTCTSLFTNQGAICDYTAFNSYATPALYCGSVVDLSNLIDYCKKADCSFCGSTELASCKTDIGNQATVYKVVYNSSLPNSPAGVGQYQGACNLTGGELCYRTAASASVTDTYWSNYDNSNPNSNAQGNISDCCVFECYNRFNFDGVKCGSDGVNYADFTAFCQAFCLDRGLYLDVCSGTPITTVIKAEQICDYDDFTLFTTRQSFIDSGRSYALVPNYCQKANCPVCNATDFATCKTELQNGDQDVLMMMVYNAVDKNNGHGSFQGSCQITQEEYCYRQQLNNTTLDPLCLGKQFLAILTEILQLRINAVTMSVWKSLLFQIIWDVQMEFTIQTSQPSATTIVMTEQ